MQAQEIKVRNARQSFSVQLEMKQKLHPVSALLPAAIRSARCLVTIQGKKNP
jgi:hypothetical protein